jgi:hypothetical protein
MRSLASLLIVAVAVAGVGCDPLGRAWGAEAEGLEPAAPLQAAPQGRDAEPPAAGVAPVTVSTAPEATAKSANPLWDVPIAALTATRDRPLFSVSRRPPPVAAPVTVMRAPPPPPREPERPSLQLVGTVIGEEESFGIFVDPSSQTSLRLRVGASHDGWLLHSLKPREAMLQKERETVRLPMPQIGQTPDGEVASGPTVAPAPPGRERVARRSR